MTCRRGSSNYEHICRVCGDPFKGTWNQKTCRLCMAEKLTKPLIPSGTVGAITELKVSVDLMSKGFHVFRALSPNAPCDLFAMKGGSQFEIEVRTAYRNPRTGKVYVNKENIRARYIAMVAGDDVIYEPDFTKLSH
jgi:hypothetical protein